MVGSSYSVGAFGSCQRNEMSIKNIRLSEAIRKYRVFLITKAASGDMLQAIHRQLHPNRLVT